MDPRENQSNELVESMIDQILDNSLDVKDAVSLALEGEEPESFVETVELNESDVECCPACGESHLELFEGEDFDALHCPACDTGFIPADDLDEGEEEDYEEGEDNDFEGMYEAELDEDDPTCPTCGGDHLVGDVFESENGEEVPHLECQDCGTLMIPVEEDN